MQAPSPLPLLLPLLALSCGSPAPAALDPDPDPRPPRSSEGPSIDGLAPADHLILPQERHLARLWQLTFRGENGEAYWSSDGGRLCFQGRNTAEGIECDRIYVTHPGRAVGDAFLQVSSGRGTTTCAYFLPDGEEVLFASTQAAHAGCPWKPDFREGYTWPLYEEMDIYVHDLESGQERVLIEGSGYDAEATVSPRADRIVFTSLRSGDLELWTCDLDGGNLFQVTDEIGYDGGAFFSHDGQRLVFRATAFTPGAEEAEHAVYRELLERQRVRPSRMEIFVIDADGTNRRQLTRLGAASFAPCFTPDDQAVLFATNHHDPNQPQRNFDLFRVDVDGGGLERVTWFDEGPSESFDGFPLFSPDGRYLAFCSNRGAAEAGETNVFVAEWRE